MSALVDFYAGRGTDAKGRKIEDIWKFSPDDLEDVHDYIQWLFPLPEKSNYNTNAPVLTQDDVRAFSYDPEMQKNLTKSFDMMLSFYGFKKTTNDEIIKADHFEDAKKKLATAV